MRSPTFTHIVPYEFEQLGREDHSKCLGHKGLRKEQNISPDWEFYSYFPIYINLRIPFRTRVVPCQGNGKTCSKLLITEGSSCQTLRFNSENKILFKYFHFNSYTASSFPPQISEECNKLNCVQCMRKIIQVWKQKLKYTVCFSPHKVFGWVLVIHLLICPFFSYPGNNFAVLPNALYSEMKLSWNKAELKWDYQRSEHMRLLWYSQTVTAAHCGVHTSWRNIRFPHTVPFNTGAVKQHKLIPV